MLNERTKDPSSQATTQHILHSASSQAHSFIRQLSTTDPLLKLNTIQHPSFSILPLEHNCMHHREQRFEPYRLGAWSLGV